MEELLTEKFLEEVRDRISDAMAAWELLAPLVAKTNSEKGPEYLGAMNKSFYRLLRLLYHVEACKVESIPEDKTVDLAGLCRDVCRNSEDMARILGTDFTWELSDSSVPSIGDQKMLELALLNLLVNAFEAAGPKGKVSLKGTLKNGQWTVTVKDNGPGFPTREKSEDPYLKTPGGIGLGLEIADRTAKLHGGNLLPSDKGKTGKIGASVGLSLPVKKPRGDEFSGPLPTNLLVPVLVEFSPLLPAKTFYEDMDII